MRYATSSAPARARAQDSPRRWLSLVGALVLSTLPSVASTSTFHTTQPETIVASTTDAELGRVIARGDFDGDGVDEIVAGQPDVAVSSGGQAREGAGIVLVAKRGSNGGFALTQVTEASVGGVPEEGDGFGHALAVGDFDDDGFDDLAIGAPFDDDASIADVGKVYVVFGSAQGLDLTNVERFKPGALAIPGPIEAGSEFGFALATGDIGDGSEDDLVIGVPGVAEAAGQIVYIPGFSGGLRRVGALALTQSDLPNVNAEAGDRFGHAVVILRCAGDVNCSDLMVVGVPFEDLGSDLVDAGVLAVFRHGLSAASFASSISRDTNGYDGEAAAFQLFGRVLAAANFSCSGKEDLIVGVPEDFTTPGSPNTGSVHLITAGGSRLTNVDSILTNDGFTSGHVFGESVIGGDFDGDGCDDIAIGTPLVFPSEAGVLQVVRGHIGGPTQADERMMVFGDDLPLSPTVIGSDSFGSALASGSFGSGGIDLVIGMPGYDRFRTDAGALVILSNTLPIFDDGFESGNLGAWSASLP